MSGVQYMLIAQALCGVKHFADGRRISLLHLCNYRASFPSPLMRALGEFPEDWLHFLVVGDLVTPDLPLTLGISFRR